MNEEQKKEIREILLNHPSGYYTETNVLFITNLIDLALKSQQERLVGEILKLRRTQKKVLDDGQVIKIVPRGNWNRGLEEAIEIIKKTL